MIKHNHEHGDPIANAAAYATRITRSRFGAIRRWQAARRRRAAAAQLERTRPAHPDYLLEDMGFVSSGRIRCLEHTVCRF